MTLPNFTKLGRRLRFLCTGVNSWAVVRYSSESQNTEGRFRKEVGLPQILTTVKECGLEVEEIGGVKPRLRQLFYLPFFFFVKVALLFFPAETRTQYFLKETSAFPTLFSDFLLVKVRKPER